MVLGTWMPGARPKARDGRSDPIFTGTTYMGPQCISFMKQEMIITRGKEKQKPPQMMLFNSVHGFASSDGQARW